MFITVQNPSSFETQINESKAYGRQRSWRICRCYPRDL